MSAPNRGSAKDRNAYRFMKVSASDRRMAVFRVWSSYNRAFKHVVLDRDGIEKRIIALSGKGMEFDQEEKALGALDDSPSNP